MDAASGHAEKLRRINASTLSADFPIVTLPDGKQAPTGTVGAMLVNVKAYDAAHSAGDTEKMEELQVRLEAAIPLLKNAGLFDLFPPKEWVGQGEGVSAGRKWVGEKALSMGM